VVEVDLHAKGTALHDATIVGDTVGDPYKDTSSVALNPVIKFTTLFGLLAVELAVSLTDQGRGTLVTVLAAVFFVISAFFVHRSFYGMRIRTAEADDPAVLEDPAPEPASDDVPAAGRAVTGRASAGGLPTPSAGAEDGANDAARTATPVDGR
jgi:K(+)-stimulated pyrophosphate-energized sodium pump